jgi:hypothetical protein
MRFIDCHDLFRIRRLVNLWFTLAIDIETFLLVLEFWDCESAGN